MGLGCPTSNAPWSLLEISHRAGLQRPRGVPRARECSKRLLLKAPGQGERGYPTRRQRNAPIRFGPRCSQRALDHPRADRSRRRRRRRARGPNLGYSARGRARAGFASDKAHPTASRTCSSGSWWNDLRHASRSTDSRSAARSTTLQRPFSIAFVTLLPPSANRFHGLYGQYGQITRLYLQ